MSCPLPPLHGCDCAHALFAGRLAQLPAARLGHWLAPWAIAEPFLHASHGAARIEVKGFLRCESWPGILTRRGWLELAKLLDVAAADPAVEWIFLEINSVVQQVKGFGAAMQALLRARRAKGVTACIRAAGGLAVPLASACHLIAATPAAPIGWLDWGMFDGIERSPDWRRSYGVSTNMLESRRVCQRFGYETLPVLRTGAMHGEQLEGRGVDWLSAVEG
jgi:hypothetical protein